MSIVDIKDYMAFVVLMGAAMSVIFSFTPKGFSVAVNIFNWFDRNVWHKHVYAEIHRLELRVDDLESIDNPAEIEHRNLGGF
jgi:hypothetical protein